MKPITAEMVRVFKLKELGFDMMGYTFKSGGQLSFHHLIVPKREGGLETFQNGSVLVQKTSHDYLHLIENLDREVFNRITLQLIDENIKRSVDRENLEAIRDLLLYFEREHDHDKTKHGKLLIKREFVDTRIPILKREKKF